MLVWGDGKVWKVERFEGMGTYSNNRENSDASPDSREAFIENYVQHEAI